MNDNLKHNIVMVETNNEVAEILSSMVFDVNAKGIEFVEDTAEPSSKVTMKIFFSMEEDIDEKVAFIEEEINNMSRYSNVGEYNISVTSLNDDDWLHNWKKHFKTFKVNDRIVIKPAWEAYTSGNDNEIIVDIDPKTVFGSGTHETTSMCIKLLDEYVKKDDKLIDVGSGTGVLGIVGAKLGISKVTCIDIDEECVKVSRENAIRNGLQDVIVVKKGDLIKEIDDKADIVVGNLLAEIIIDLIKDIKKVIKQEGMFITSGIILQKEAMIIDALKGNGFEIIKVLRDGEWVAIASQYIGDKSE